MKQFIFILTVVFSLSSFSGGMESGGGHGLVCFTSSKVANAVREAKGIILDKQLKSISSIEPIDLYFAKNAQGAPLEKIDLIKARRIENFRQLYKRILFCYLQEHPKLLATQELYN